MWTGSTVLYLSISVVLKERHAIVAAVAGMLWRCWTSRGVIKLGELKGLKTWVTLDTGCRAERAAGYGGCTRAASGPSAVAAVQVRGAR